MMIIEARSSPELTRENIGFAASGSNGIGEAPSSFVRRWRRPLRAGSCASRRPSATSRASTYESLLPAVKRSRPRKYSSTGQAEMRLTSPGHDPARFGEFGRRYRVELRTRTEQIGQRRARARTGTVTLVYGARDTGYNDAVVLAEVPRGGVGE